MKITVNKTISNVTITIDSDDIYLHKDIIEELRVQGITVNENFDVIYCNDDHKELDTDDYYSVREVLDHLERKGTLVLEFKPRNKPRTTTPVIYPKGRRK